MAAKMDDEARIVLSFEPGWGRVNSKNHFSEMVTNEIKLNVKQAMPCDDFQTRIW